MKNMKNMKKIISMVPMLVGVLMAQNGPLANGVYAVEEDNAKAKNPVVRRYEGKNVVLDTAAFAPLLIQGRPEINRDPRGSSLMIQLAPEAAKRLEDLTRSHMNRRIAVVVDDKILSAPKVRRVIEDGKARLTPCEDESCDTLLRQLSK